MVRSYSKKQFVPMVDYVKTLVARPPEPASHQILQAVCEATGYSRKEMRGAERGDKDLVRARQWTTFLGRAWTSSSFRTIRRETGLHADEPSLANNVSDVAKSFYCNIPPVRAALEKANLHEKYQDLNEKDQELYDRIFSPFRKAALYVYDIGGAAELMFERGLAEIIEEPDAGKRSVSIRLKACAVVDANMALSAA